MDFGYQNSTNDDQEFDGTERVKYKNGAGVEEMKYLIEIGADGIMTNYPHRLKAVYDSYGKAA